MGCASLRAQPIWWILQIQVLWSLEGESDLEPARVHKHHIDHRGTRSRLSTSAMFVKDVEGTPNCSTPSLTKCLLTLPLPLRGLRQMSRTATGMA
eukprot:5359-Amphidinium_carterae.1